MLQENDVIYLRSGMKVGCPDFPEKFIPGNPMSRNFIREIVQVGFVYRNDTYVGSIRKNLLQDIQLVFRNARLRLDEDIAERFVSHQVKNPEAEEFVVPEGEYLVTNIIEAENFQRVYVTTLTFDPDKPPMVLDFYQNSNEENNIDDVKPLRRLFSC